MRQGCRLVALAALAALVAAPAAAQTGVTVHQQVEITSTAAAALALSGGVTVDGNAVVGISGDLTVARTGPHAIGTTTSSTTQIRIGGSFTGSGGSVLLGTHVFGDLTAAAGQTSWQTQARIAGTITTQNASETIEVVSGLRIEEPTITIGTDTVTDAASLYVTGAPTEGSRNLAAWFGGVVRTDGTLRIGETSNASMSLGLTVNQGTADNELLAGKSSDVAHGMTTLTETDTYLTGAKISATDGGAELRGYSEATEAARIAGSGVTDVTTKTSGTTAYIELDASKKSGTTVGVAGTNAALVAMRNLTTTRWILDAEGDTWQAGGATFEGDVTFNGTVSGVPTVSQMFSPGSNQPPAASYATADTRNAILVLDFDDAADESAVFGGVLSPSYQGGGLTVDVYWMATSATSGSVVWDVSVERGTTDLDADSFAAVNSATTATSGTSGILTKTTVTFTDGADMDSLAAGESYRLKVTRDANHASDTMAGDAELVRVLVEESGLLWVWVGVRRRRRRTRPPVARVLVAAALVWALPLEAARTFNGTTQRLGTSGAVVTATPLSLACWFFPSSQTSDQSLIGIETAGGGDAWSLQIALGVSDRTVGAVLNDGTGFEETETSTTYTPDTWNHGAAVFTSSTSRAAYLNGGGKGTGTTSVSPSGVNQTQIAETGSLWYQGTLAECGIWNVALTDADVAALAAGLAPPLVRPDGLQAYYPIEGNTSPERDLFGDLPLTVTNAPPKADHPRIYRPF